MKLLFLIGKTAPIRALRLQDRDMSLRAVAHRLLQNGRIFLRRHYFDRNIKDASVTILPRGAFGEAGVNSASVFRNVQHHARRLFIDSVLKRVTNSLAADLRRRAAKRLLFGDSAPFLAFVGISLASGTGIITKEDELEGICWEIRDAVSKMEWDFTHAESDEVLSTLSEKKESICLADFTLGKAIAKGSNAVVYTAKLKEDRDPSHVDTDEFGSAIGCKFPLAVKMMFNYDAESNALSILRSMYRETVPAMKCYSNEDTVNWQESFSQRCRSLPPHPNIVQVYCAFADNVPLLPESFSLYPNALPARINPEGYGRNMSLFLVMKRYDVCLKDFLSNGALNTRISILLLTQLLEAVAHMVAHGIAHRDLKTDNILLDISEGNDVCPSLVVSDFGCCLADRVCGLSLPYTSPDTDKGGNAALMAPEVTCVEPGPFKYINYSKADVWAVGTLAYELFGMRNPFYFPNKQNPKDDLGSPLQSRTYRESDLPPLPESVPTIVAQLITEMLSRNPSKRVSAEFAATVCQLFLWAPSAWLHLGEASKLPSSAEILQWLLCLTTKILCEGRKINMSSSYMLKSNSSTSNFDVTTSNPNLKQFSGRRTLPEYQLIATFLRRVKLSEIRKALQWIQTV